MRSLTLLYLLLPILAWSEMHERTQVAMGTLVSLRLPSTPHTLFADGFRLIAEVERSLSTYRSSALLSQLNAKHRIPYDNFLADALTQSKHYYQLTDGYFDVTVGSISKSLYRFGELSVRSATAQELDRAVLDIEGIRIEKNYIESDEDIAIDLGGMGKGYTVDILSQWLAGEKVTRGRIALSGDIRCLNRCEVGLQSPFGEQIFALVETDVPQVAFSTSGTYRRVATKSDEHHLIDPKRRRQSRDFLSISLFGLGDNSRLDAYATAVGVMPRAKALAFLRENPQIGFVLVSSEGEVLYGHLPEWVKLSWVGYSESATIPITSSSNRLKKNSAKSLTHPNISHPILIMP